MKHAQMKKVLLLSALVVLVACVVLWLAVSRSASPKMPEKPARTEGGLPVIAPAELKITPSKDGVEEFLKKNEGYTSMYEEDTCYNITPDHIAGNSDFTIFKYDKSTASFVMYEGEVYVAGEYFGGDGIESMALADVDMDGQYELYYTFSWGSGIHRTKIGYFDPAAKETKTFDYASFSYGMMLTANEDGELCVNTALYDLDHTENWFVDYAICAGKQMGSIILEDGEITLKIDPEYEGHETL